MKIFILITMLWICMGYTHQAQVPIRNNYNQYAVYQPNNRYIVECYGISCPRGTTHCNTRSTPSADDKKLLTTIECRDYYGYVLNSEVKSITVPNFFGGVGSGSHYGDYYYGNGNGYGNQGSGGYYGQPEGDYYRHGNGDSESYENKGSRGKTNGHYYIDESGSYHGNEDGGGNHVNHGSSGNYGEGYLGNGIDGSYGKHTGAYKKSEHVNEIESSDSSKGNVVYILVNSSRPLEN